MFFYEFPGGVTNCPGGPLILTAKYITAQGMDTCNSTALPYLGTAVWQLNGSNLPVAWSTNYLTGANYSVSNFTFINGAETKLTIPNTSSALSGNFQVFVISNICPYWAGNTSPVIRVATGAAIFGFPTTNRTVSVCQPFTLTADAGGAGAVQFQWLRNGLPLSDDGRVTGSHTLNLAVAAANFADEGSYQLVVTPGCGNAVTSAVTEVFITPSPAWVTLAKQGPDTRTDHRMVYDSDRRVIVLFGGGVTSFSTSAPPNGRFNDTWEFDGTNWWQRFPATVPPARLNFAMSYDSQRKRVVMFGGNTNSGAAFASDARNADTWEWDGNDWTRRTPVSSPSARYFSANACCYDRVRHETLVFGGDAGTGGVLSELWAWNGTNWTQKTWSGISPTNQGWAEMSFDPDRGRAWLIGVFDGLATDYAKTIWSWNGTNWQTGPASSVDTYYGNSANNGFAYDGYRHEAATFGSVFGLIGGFLSTSVYPTGWDGYRSVWTWNGLRWQADKPAPTPPNNDLILGPQMVYDDARQMLVLFGGYSGYITNYTYALHYATDPKFLIPPQARTNGNVTTFCAVVAGVRPMAFQWKRSGTNVLNGANISGATTDTLTITNLASAEISAYTLVASNQCGLAVSSAANLAANLAPGSLKIYPGGLGVIVEWSPSTLKLQEAPALTGPWTTNLTAATPYSTPVSASARFYRVRP
ncbi:MAG: kelch repeat-containing protein [Verrucomicrobiota bacterium]